MVIITASKSGWYDETRNYLFHTATGYSLAELRQVAGLFQTFPVFERTGMSISGEDFKIYLFDKMIAKSGDDLIKFGGDANVAKTWNGAVGGTPPPLTVVILGDGAPEKKAYHALLMNYRNYLQNARDAAARRGLLNYPQNGSKGGDISVAADTAALQAVGARSYIFKGIYGKKDPPLAVLMDQFDATLGTIDRVCDTASFPHSFYFDHQHGANSFEQDLTAQLSGAAAFFASGAGQIQLHGKDLANAKSPNADTVYESCTSQQQQQLAYSYSASAAQAGSGAGPESADAQMGG